MNIAVAEYYQTAPSTSTGVDVSDIATLRRLYKASQGVKLSQASAEVLAHVSDQVVALGGLQRAQEKLSAAADWLAAWDEGELAGKALAQSWHKTVISRS